MAHDTVGCFHANRDVRHLLDVRHWDQDSRVGSAAPGPCEGRHYVRSRS